jgi:hypothetical protein
LAKERPDHILDVGHKPSVQAVDQGLDMLEHANTIFSTFRGEVRSRSQTLGIGHVADIILPCTLHVGGRWREGFPSCLSMQRRPARRPRRCKPSCQCSGTTAPQRPAEPPRRQLLGHASTSRLCVRLVSDSTALQMLQREGVAIMTRWVDWHSIEGGGAVCTDMDGICSG